MTLFCRKKKTAAYTSSKKYQKIYTPAEWISEAHTQRSLAIDYSGSVVL